MASAGGGGGATDEIPEVEMEVVERLPEEPGWVGLKRVRDPHSALGSYGFYGVTTAEKKPMLQPHVNALRLSSPSPGEYPYNKTKRATKLCTFYAQGWCQNGKNCTFLHEKEGFGSAKAGLLAPAGSGNHRGSEEGSQVQHQPNLKVPQFKDAEGSSKHELYRSLVHMYGEDNEKLAHLADKQNLTTPGVSQRLPGSIDDSFSTRKPTAPINELVQSLVVHEMNHKPFMGHPIGLAAERRRYLDVNTLNSAHQFQSSGTSISSDPLQFHEKLSAYGGTTDNIPNTHQKEHSSSHASYSSHNLTGFRNLGYATSENSLGSPSLRATSQLGIQSHHLFRTGIEEVNLCRCIDVDNGCTSGSALLSSSSLDPSIISAGPLSPIKDEVWETSVPFVPSFSFPTPPGSPYDPFVDCIEHPKVGKTDNLSRDDKLTRNMSAVGANGSACLIASNRGRSSSLDVNNRVKACDRKNDVASSDEKARDFRFHLAEHIKDLIKPIWKEGDLSKDAHKQVVKKSVEKVVDSIEPNQVPTTKEMIAKYLTTNGSKIEKLVKAYVDRHRTT